MAKKQNFWYVLVMTDNGPVFVTDIPERNWAQFDKDKTPMEFYDKDYAKETAFGLLVNGHVAYAVCSHYALEFQPYAYERGHFEWSDD